MSTKVTYRADAVILDYLSGTTWHPLDVATITWSASYDVSERGVLLVNPDTCEFTVSRWVDEPIAPLAEGTVIRLRYVQPGVDELYRGVITDVFIDYSADAGTDWYGKPWRADHRVSTTGLAASRMAAIKSWNHLPAETVSARLGRWISVVDLAGATDALMPPETTKGSTTLLEIIRAACDYLGRSVRLVNSGTHTEVHVTTASTALPAGYTNGDALDIYTRASVVTTAGDRALSLAAADATLTVSADLAPDDVRILYSPWRIPEPLPVPFADAVHVSGFTMTFTPDMCTGSLEFSYDTASKLRYRPPAPYVPGDPTSTKGHGGSTGSTGGDGTPQPPDNAHAYLLAFTEVAPPAATGGPVITDANGVGPPIAVSIVETGTWPTHYGVQITPATTPVSGSSYGVSYQITGTTGTRVLGGSAASGATIYFNPADLAAYCTYYGLGTPVSVTISDTAPPVHVIATGPGFTTTSSDWSETFPAIAADGASGTITITVPSDFSFSAGAWTGSNWTFVGSSSHTWGLRAFVLNGSGNQFDNGNGIGFDNTPDAYHMGPGNFSVPPYGGIPAGIAWWNYDNQGNALGTAPAYTWHLGDAPPVPVVPDPSVNVDGAPMIPMNFRLDAPPRIASFMADSVDPAGTYTLTFENAELVTSIQATGSFTAITEQITSGTTAINLSLDVSTDDAVFVYASATGTGEPVVTASDPTSIPLERDQGGTTDTTAFALHKATAQADGAYSIIASAAGDLVLSVIVATPS